MEDKKTMAEKTPVNVWVEKKLYSDCKIEAIKRDVTLAEFVSDALSFYIEKSVANTVKKTKVKLS